MPLLTDDAANKGLGSTASWLEWIEDHKAALKAAGGDDMSAHVALIELYRRALQDFLCTSPLCCLTGLIASVSELFFWWTASAVPLLHSYGSHFVTQYYLSLGEAAPPAGDEPGEDPMATADTKVGEENPVLQVIFSLEEVRAALHEMLSMGEWHLTQVRFFFSFHRSGMSLMSARHRVRVLRCGLY